MTLPYKLLALAILLAGLWMAHAWDRSRAASAGYLAGQSEVQGRWQAALIVAQQAALEAEQAARAETDRRNAEQRTQDEIDAKKLAAVRAAITRSDSVARSMRKRTAELEAAARSCPAGDDPVATAERETADAAARMLAELRAELERRARALAQYADEARAAGESCQRRYESLMR